MISLNRDVKLFAFLLFVTITSVYFLPASLSRVIFLIILIIAYSTKLDYVFLVWYLVINDAPGRLFFNTQFEGDRIPLYPIIPEVSFSFQELFLMVYIIKLLYKKEWYFFIFKKQFKIFVLVGIFYVLYGLVLGTGINEIVKIFRILIPWSLVFIIPAFLKDRIILSRAFKLLFPIVLVAFIAQLHAYFTGTYWDDILRHVSLGSLKIGKDFGVSRAYSAVWIIFLATIQSLYYLVNKQRPFNRYYLIFILFLSTLSIFLTATRGWIISYIIIFFGILLLYGFSKIKYKVFLVLAGLSVFFILVVSFIPIIKVQIHGVLERLATIETLVEGDQTAGGTLIRLTERGPRVMDKFKESPILGWGFSKTYFQFQDGHVGNQTMLLNTGLIGYLYLSLLYLYFLYKIVYLYVIDKNRFKSLLIYFYGLLALFVIHSTSTMSWGYIVATPTIIIYAMILTSINLEYYSYFRQNGWYS